MDDSNNQKSPRRLPVLIVQILIFLAVGAFLGYQYHQRELQNPDSKLALAHEALVEGDDAAALKLYGGLANAGNARAQYQLGDMYEFGYGVPKDASEAISWFKKAADQGLAVAQGRLGEIYFAGNKTVQDFEAARSWLQKAADQKNAVAQRRLGQMEEQGLGGPQDPVRAYALYETAILNGDGYAVRLRDSLLKRMSPVQISQGQALAKKMNEPK
jgi:TPR repeat protein